MLAADRLRRVRFGRAMGGEGMTGQTTFDELLEGRRLRDEGVERVELAEGEDWKDAARGWLARRAARPGEFNADDLRAAVGSPERPNAMGAVFLWAVRQGLVRMVGMRQRRAANAHAQRIAVYVGA